MVSTDVFEQYIQPVVDFVRERQASAAPIVFALAFMESLTFVSLLVPAWGVLVLIGLRLGRRAADHRRWRIAAHSDGLEVSAAFFFRLRSIAPTMLE